MRRAVPGAAAGLRALLSCSLAVLLLLAWRRRRRQDPVRPTGFDRSTASVMRPPRPRPAPFSGSTLPGLDTPFAIGADVGAYGRAPELIAGGPTGAGQAMRLAFDAPVPTQNSIAFDRTDIGAFDQIVVDFDFRAVPADGRAGGLGVALLNTAAFGSSGAVAPQAPLFAADEPNFIGSIGVGFGVDRPGDPPTEASRNHLSVHFDGQPGARVDLGPALDLASGEWTHVRIVARPSELSDVTVSLAGCGRAAITVVDRLAISGLAPYESRLQIAARAGG